MCIGMPLRQWRGKHPSHPCNDGSAASGHWILYGFPEHARAHPVRQTTAGIRYRAENADNPLAAIRSITHTNRIAERPPLHTPCRNAVA
ncbi:protein of unknown function (plasmid) [Azospirillum lipoferum 4B]|uniref:Uncharacterized protein n=1 Tax=Azospirillum lipoferum (strain 4B) TaxID=862719 RepID=G7ZDP5_AZOL4|nr:protein of unknown function [Azospirillum lipoferum 4B]